VQRKISGPKGQETSEECRILHKKKLHDVCSKFSIKVIQFKNVTMAENGNDGRKREMHIEF
jgi:hypothetical protein